MQAVHKGGPAGPTPLDALDAFAHTAINAGQAAKLILLAAAPYGLSFTSFHPGSGATTPVNLLTTLDPAGCAGNPANYGLFNATLYGALAKKLAVRRTESRGARDDPRRAAHRRRMELPR